jgi:SAM-dependent methyltransferase
MRKEIMKSSISETCRKVIRHAREGTLLARIYEEIRSFGRRGQADPDHYHGDVAKGYLKKRLEQKSWHVEQNIMRELLAEFPDGSKVLDVPFGTGRFVDMYLRKGMSVYGVDISQDMLTAAKEALGESYERCSIHLGSAESLPYENDFFDLVVCFRFFGLISLEMANNVLAEIHRVTKDKAIIRVPVLKETTEDLAPPKPYQSVQGRLLETQLVAMFKAFGFEVVQMKLIEDRPKVSYKVYVLTKVRSKVHG